MNTPACPQRWAALIASFFHGGRVSGARGRPDAVERGLTLPERSRGRVVALLSALLAASAVIGPAAARAATAPPIAGVLSGVAAISPSDAWAVGFTQHTTVLTEHWNGSAWVPVPGGNPGYVNQLTGVSATSAGDVWAVGTQFYTGQTETYHPLVEHNGGTGWRVVPSPTFGSSSYLVGVDAISPINVWAVGYYDQSPGDYTLIEHFDGKAWTRIPSPSPDLDASGYGVDTLSGVWGSGPSDVWAVGSYYANSNRNLLFPLILHWNGRSWTQVSSAGLGAPQESDLNGVSGSSATNATAVGARYIVGQGWRSLIEHWNGRQWTVAPSPNPAGTGDTQLYGVTAAAAQQTWAVGQDVTAGNGVILRSNSQRWQLAGAATTGDTEFSGVSADNPSDAWAVGAAEYGQLVYTVIEHWNGTAWAEVTGFP